MLTITYKILQMSKFRTAWGVSILSFTRGGQNFQALINPTLKTLNGTFTQGNQSYPFNGHKI